LRKRSGKLQFSGLSTPEGEYRTKSLKWPKSYCGTITRTGTHSTGIASNKSNKSLYTRKTPADHYAGVFLLFYNTLGIIKGTSYD